jgi:hypothetical protein
MSVSSAVSEWSTVGRGGKVVSFPPEAAGAFGRHGGGSFTRVGRQPRVDFDAAASAAFGRRGGGFTRVGRQPRVDFDAAASAAFGRRQGARGEGGGAGFDDAASAAFGRRQGARGECGGAGFDDAASAAFGRRQGARGEGGGAGFDDAASAAFGRRERDGFGDAASNAFGKKSHYRGIDDGKTPLDRHMESVRAAAEAAKPPPTYEEAFPTLGGNKTAAVAASPAPAKPTYASFAKKLAESEAAADRMKARRAAEEAERERRERLDRQSYGGLYTLRHRDIVYNDCEDDTNVDVEEEAPAAGDLDYDAYGRRRSDIDYLPPAASDESSTETDETEEEDADA